MNKEGFDCRDLYAFYCKCVSPEGFFLSEASFAHLLQRGTGKRIACARNGSGIRCMLLYLPVGEFSYIITQCGDLRKLEGKLPQLLSISTQKEKDDAHQEECFLRLFTATAQYSLLDENKRFDFQGFTWKRIETDKCPAFFTYQIIDPCQKPIGIFTCWTQSFEQKRTGVLVSCDLFEHNLEKEFFLRILLSVFVDELGTVQFLVCDDVFPGFERYCDGYRILYRNRRVPVFVC